MSLVGLISYTVRGNNLGLFYGSLIVRWLHYQGEHALRFN